MADDPEDQPIELVKLKPSNDWLATFYCFNCSAYHHMLLLKQRVHFKAILVENARAHSKTSAKLFGTYKNRGGAPDDKVIDDIEDEFGPPDDGEDDDDDDEEDETDE